MRAFILRLSPVFLAILFSIICIAPGKIMAAEIPVTAAEAQLVEADAPLAVPEAAPSTEVVIEATPTTEAFVALADVEAAELVASTEPTKEEVVTLVDIEAAPAEELLAIAETPLMAAAAATLSEETITDTTLVEAEAPVGLGTTADFAILAGETVTNTGPTVIGGSAGGNVGVSPGTSVTGFPPGTISDGIVNTNDAVAIQAQIDLVTAYNDAAGRIVTSNLTDQDLAGMTLTTGVYSFDSSAQLSGTLILDAEGNPDAAFIFQIGSTLTTASASTISLINGAQYCRVFWQVGSSATLGTNSHFIGHIFAMQSITATTDASVQGQLLAREGAVTLDSNVITNGVCDAETVTPTPTPTPTSTTGTTPTETTPTTTTVTASTTTVDQLPRTGESSEYGLLALILLMVDSALVLYQIRKRTN